MVTFYKSFQRLGVKQNYIAAKDNFEILRWPFVTFNDICGLILFNVSIHRNLYYNQFINECARKKMLKSESLSFFVRYRS